MQRARSVTVGQIWPFPAGSHGRFTGTNAPASLFARTEPTRSSRGPTYPDFRDQSNQSPRPIASDPGGRSQPQLPNKSPALVSLRNG